MRAHALAHTTSDDWDRAMAINARAPFLLMQAAASLLHDGGVIIQLSDHLAFETGHDRFIAHQASKAAATNLVATMAAALAPRLRVNAIAPGLVLAPSTLSAAARDAFLADVPLGREGSPSDVALAVNFLVDAVYVTGVTLAVDGGRHLRR
jgi:pteridine reductase